VACLKQYLFTDKYLFVLGNVVVISRKPKGHPVGSNRREKTL